MKVHVKDRVIWVANHPLLLLGLYLGTLLTAGKAYSFIEDVSLIDGIWWAVVTSSTVGYGDLSPSTFEGKVLGGVVIAVTIFLVLPLITALFTARVIRDDNEFSHEEQEEMKERQREILVAQEANAARLQEIVGKLPDLFTGLKTLEEAHAAAEEHRFTETEQRVTLELLSFCAWNGGVEQVNPDLYRRAQAAIAEHSPTS